MKNLFVLPTPKPSRLQLKMNNTFHIENGQSIPLRSYQHIYIISDETFNKDSWCLHQIQHEYYLTKAYEDMALLHYKVILTTDPELIKDGVQPIDDTFLEWFVKNPSCEQVDVIYGLFNPMGRQVDPMNLAQNHSECVWKYNITFPKKDSSKIREGLQKSIDGKKHFVEHFKNGGTVENFKPKQESLEQAAENYIQSKNPQWTPYHKQSFKNGAKWQQENIIEELEMHILVNEHDWNRNPQAQFRDFVEQLKKK